MRGFAVFALESARGRCEGCVPTGLSPVFQDPSQSADATFCEQFAECLATLTWEQLAEADPSRASGLAISFPWCCALLSGLDMGRAMLHSVRPVASNSAMPEAVFAFNTRGNAEHLSVR